MLTNVMQKLKLANSAREAAMGRGGSASISIDSPFDEENSSCTHRGNAVNGLIDEDFAARVSGIVVEGDEDVSRN